MSDTRQVSAKHPLAAVFGFPTDNHSPAAQRHRRAKLCPYHNKVPNCTKDKALDPLGVCSIYSESGEATITCPIRFREDWIIAEDAASFCFPAGTSWTSLTEIRLKDGNGLSAGNIDVVLVAYDERVQLLDFGSLEVQDVYISGNVRNPFYHSTCRTKQPLWSGVDLTILVLTTCLHQENGWHHSCFTKAVFSSHATKSRPWLSINPDYATLPALPEVAPQEADMAWFLYSLEWHAATNRFHLTRHRIVYTAFEPAMLKITTAPAGPIEDFIAHVQSRLNNHLHPPDAPTLQDGTEQAAPRIS